MRKHRSLLLAVFATNAAIAALIACSSDDAAPAPTPDAGSSPDAAVAPVEDANVDLGQDTAAPPTYCQGLSPAPAFCKDFDEFNSNTGEWSLKAVSPNQTLLVTTDGGTSSPGALTASLIPPVPTGASASVLEHIPAHRLIRVAVDLMLTYDGTGAATILQMTYQPTPSGLTSATVALAINGKELDVTVSSSIVDASEDNTTSKVVDLKLATWTRVQVEIDPGANGVRVLDGKETVLAQTDFPALVSAGEDVSVGLVHTGGDPIVTEWQLAIDNFVVTVGD